MPTQQRLPSSAPFGRLRRALTALALLLIGGAGGYGAAIWTGGAVPIFLRQAASQRQFDLSRDHLVSLLRTAESSARNSSDALTRATIDAASVGLERAIHFSRAQALRENVHQLDPETQQMFAPYFDEAVLTKARWTIADARIGLGSILAGWYNRESAVTLQDVIVFSDEKTAQNRTLMAHELFHVAQYEALGVSGFARLYTMNHNALEDQAWENAFRLMGEIRRRDRAETSPRAATVASNRLIGVAEARSVTR